MLETLRRKPESALKQQESFSFFHLEKGSYGHVKPQNPARVETYCHGEIKKTSRIITFCNLRDFNLCSLVDSLHLILTVTWAAKCQEVLFISMRESFWGCLSPLTLLLLGQLRVFPSPNRGFCQRWQEVG